MAEQFARQASRFRIPWVTSRPTPPAPPVDAENQSTVIRNVPTRRFSFQLLPESVPPSEPPPQQPLPPPPKTEPLTLLPSTTEPKTRAPSERQLSIEIQIQSISSEESKPSPPTYQPSQTSSQLPSPKNISQLETTPGITSTTSPSGPPLESQVQESIQPLAASGEASLQQQPQYRKSVPPPEPLSPPRQASESQSKPQAVTEVLTEPLASESQLIPQEKQPPSLEGLDQPQQQQMPASPQLAVPPPPKQALESQPKSQAIIKPSLPSNDSPDQNQQSQTSSLLPEPLPPPKQAPEQQPTPQPISQLPSPSSEDSLKQQSQLTSLPPETPIASEQGPKPQNTAEAVPLQPTQSNEAPLQQQQSQTTARPTGSLPPSSQTPESPPTHQAISQSPSPPNGSSHQQQLSASIFEPTPNETSGAQPALPKTQPEVSNEPISLSKDQTQIKANTELGGTVTQQSQFLGDKEMDTLNSIKPQELLAPPQPLSSSHSHKQSARATSSRPTSPPSPAKLATPTSSHPSSPSKQTSQLQTKSLPSSQQLSQSQEVSETQPPSETTSKTSSPSRSSTIQPEPSTNKKDIMFQPLPSAVVPQDPELKEQISPEQQFSQALDQTQTPGTLQSDRETKELSQTRTSATVERPTAAPKAHSPSPWEFFDVPTILDEPPKSETIPKEINDGKLRTEAETKTKDRLVIPADEESKQRTITKLPNLPSESNKHVAGQSDITTPEDKKKLEKQPTRNRREMAATGFQVLKGEVAPTAHPKKKIEGSWWQTKSSASQGEPVSLNKDINEGLSRFVQKLAQGPSNQSMDGNPTSVIALCGTNTGASMHMGPKNLKAGQSNIVGEYKLNQNFNEDVHAEGEIRLEPTRLNDSISKAVHARKTYVNNNVQGINNSILYTSSIRGRTPGVHLAFSHKPTESLNLSSTLENIEASHNLTAVDKDDSET